MTARNRLIKADRMSVVGVPSHAGTRRDPSSVWGGRRGGGTWFARLGPNGSGVVLPSIE